MIGHPTRLILVVLGLGIPIAPLHAQLDPTAERSRAVIARLHTPGGTLAPLPISVLDDSSQLGFAVHAQFAVAERSYVELQEDATADGSRELAWAVGVELPMGSRLGPLRSPRVGASVAAIEARCLSTLLGERTRSCPVGHMLGLSARALLWESRVGTGSARPGWALGLAADWGRGRQQSRAEARGVSVPVYASFRIRRKNWLTETDPRFQPRTVLFLEPGLSRATLANGDQETTAQLVQLAGGVSVLDIGPGFGAGVTLRRILVDGAPMQIAFAFSWHQR